MSELIACQDCRKYFFDRHSNGDIWYNHQCGVPCPDEFNPVIGAFQSPNRTRFCRDFNGKGDCEHFDPKIRG